MMDPYYEFCGGNIINDERRRFKLKDEEEYEEIDPILPWQNLTYIGDLNLGGTICGVCQKYLFLQKNQFLYFREILVDLFLSQL